jgi:hypothetical protein
MRAKKARYDQLPFAESFAAFSQQRNDLVARLGGLPPEAWQRFAIVNVPHRPGRPWPLTVRTCLWGMADHESGHCRQMEQFAATFK